MVGACWDMSTLALVMEFAPGGNLQHVLHGSDSVQRSMRGGTDVRALPWALLVELLRQAAEGIRYLHSLRRPIAHFDVKPANFVLDNSFGNLRLCDFGLAREVDGDMEHCSSCSHASSTAG